MANVQPIAIGGRLSYGSAICTLRYIGPVAGTDQSTVWFGVEWDDHSRGKHDGSHQGQRYFTCKSPSPTAASFIKSSRSQDPSRSFIQAVKRKYADEDHRDDVSERPNVISGKVVEEVGFDKIQEQQRRLHELKIVLVDGQQINAAEDATDEVIETVCPSIVELDLSRNLLSFQETHKIIRRNKLPHLRLLKLNGNRFSELDSRSRVEILDSLEAIPVGELHMDDVLLRWDQLCNILSKIFKSLTTFSASSNILKSLDYSIPIHSLKTLILDFNQFATLSDLTLLKQCSSLEILRLKGNSISSVAQDPFVLTPSHQFGDKLRYVDLSYNAIASWKFVDDLDYCFPGLTELRLSHNPIYETSSDSQASGGAEEGYMLTLARLGKLTNLNFSRITAAERSNAEMFYLSRIGRAIAEVPETEAASVIAQHKRYAVLCEKYGEPAIIRSNADGINPLFLEARLIRFTFYLPQRTRDGKVEKITLSKEIPKSFDVYRVKGIVGKLFGVPPLNLRLTWETGEWDPVAGYEEEEESSGDDEEGSEKITVSEKQVVRETGRLMKREVEIEESTRVIGNCVDGLEATIRVEVNKTTAVLASIPAM
ncbi:CAP-Gly domain-containing protein [Mollisia scopiformis]|uniref:CAP-Gly domain-containing protein n=1 Tax=Mollisia scopiformis TaxID=149040 RepID=A0A132B6G6_MOLSC|nr:CAP-Gly domain-containing protein [Mollisia scopiformis]KUJ07931.1 CAP-Gly domain-containing protein [Mollisia scopiformis]